MIEYYKVYKSFEVSQIFKNDIKIDIICQTQSFEEANDCYNKLLVEFYDLCKDNIDNQDIEFCTDDPIDDRTNSEIPLHEVTSLYSNHKNCWWNKPELEKVTIEFFNKSHDNK